MILTLDAHAEELIQQQIASGAFSDPVAVVTHALELVQAEGEENQARENLSAHLEKSWEQIQQGHGIPGKRIEAMIAARTPSR